MHDVHCSTEAAEEGASPDAEDQTADSGQGRENALCQQAFAIAIRQAARVGFSGEGVEDCAIGFVCQFLVRFRQNPPCPCTEAWLNRCAVNYARNLMRSQRRRRHQERCFTEVCSVTDFPSSGGNNPSIPIWNHSPDGHNPEATIIRQELCERIKRAVEVAKLSPAHQDLLQAYYVTEQTAADIARAEGRTANAVRQELWALRQRLRAALEAQHFDYTEALGYRAILSVLALYPSG